MDKIFVPWTSTPFDANISNILFAWAFQPRTKRTDIVSHVRIETISKMQPRELYVRGFSDGGFRYNRSDARSMVVWALVKSWEFIRRWFRNPSVRCCAAKTAKQRQTNRKSPRVPIPNGTRENSQFLAIALRVSSNSTGHMECEMIFD